MTADDARTAADYLPELRSVSTTSLAESSCDAVQEYECGWCRMSADLCLAMRAECCPDCTHYDEPPAPDDDLDEVAVMRAMSGDLTVTLNRQEAAEAHQRLKAKGLSNNEVAERLGTSERQIDRWNQGHTRPITRRGRTMTDTIDELLAQASRNPAKRIKTAAGRAQDAVQRVRDLLAEDAGKAEARERVARLERELRDAKAALRNKPAGAPSASPIDSKAIRTWANDTGMVCPATGRVPNAVIDAYNTAHRRAS